MPSKLYENLILPLASGVILGEVLEVLVDDKPRSQFTLAGRASNNKIVNFDGPDSLMGRLVALQITGFGPNSLKGTLIHQGPEEP